MSRKPRKQTKTATRNSEQDTAPIDTGMPLVLCVGGADPNAPIPPEVADPVLREAALRKLGVVRGPNTIVFGPADFVRVEPTGGKP